MRKLLQKSWFPPEPKSRRAKPGRGGFLAVVLAPLTPAFRAASGIKRAFTRTAELPVAVVVVGNLIVGGSGKTPLVIALVEALRAEGFTPGVVSRGYGGSLVRKTRAVHAVDADAPEAADRFGDEPTLIRWKTQAPVFVGKRRVAAARALLAAHPDVDVVIADDGLQHRALPRNFEIAVFDDRRAGNGRLLPAGPLREPLSRLARVDAVVLNGEETTLPELGKTALVAEPYRMTLEPGRAYRINDPLDTRAMHDFRGQRLTAAAGIANPERFFQMLRAFGLSFHRMPLDDHHAFHENPFDTRTSEAIVMTEKDAIKCRRFEEPRMWAIPVSARIERRLVDAILANIGTSRKGKA